MKITLKNLKFTLPSPNEEIHIGEIEFEAGMNEINCIFDGMKKLSSGIVEDIIKLREQEHALTMELLDIEEPECSCHNEMPFGPFQAQHINPKVKTINVGVDPTGKVDIQGMEGAPPFIKDMVQAIIKKAKEQGGRA